MKTQLTNTKNVSLVKSQCVQPRPPPVCWAAIVISTVKACHCGLTILNEWRWLGCFFLFNINQSVSIIKHWNWPITAFVWNVISCFDWCKGYHKNFKQFKSIIYPYSWSHSLDTSKPAELQLLSSGTGMWTRFLSPVQTQLYLSLTNCKEALFPHPSSSFSLLFFWSQKNPGLVWDAMQTPRHLDVHPNFKTSFSPNAWHNSNR